MGQNKTERLNYKSQYGQQINSYKEKFIPIWELEFEKHEDYGPQYKVKDDWHTFSESALADVYYDINTKKITSGEVIDFKNKEDKLPKVGNLIFYEKDHNLIKRAKLLDIKWVVDQNYIGLGQKVEKNWLYYVKGIKLDYNKLYHIKVYEPRYIIEGESQQIWPYAVKTVEL